MLSNTRRVCAAMSPSTSCPVAGSSGTWPETKQQLAGADGLRVRADRFGARRSGNRAAFTRAFVNLACRAQAARADADPLDAAVDHRPHHLKVRLEPPRADVVRMTVLPADDRALSTNFTSLGHAAFTS